jgi:hypothetical protein
MSKTMVRTAAGRCQAECHNLDVPEPIERDPSHVAAEYAATNATYLQYDAFRWQAGGLLFAGAFVFLGFLISKGTTAVSLWVGSLVVAAVMGFWMLYSQHYRQLYLFKINRLLDLEHAMGAEQHRRFHEGHGVDHKMYPTIGIKGHHLDQLVYSALALGGPLLAAAQHQWSWPMWLVISTVPAVLATVWRQECMTKKHLRSRPMPISRDSADDAE